MAILSNQIAPVFNSFLLPKNESTIENSLHKIIKEANIDAENSLSPVSYILFRIIIKNDLNNYLLLNEIELAYKKYFSNIINKPKKIFWLTLDSGLLILPETEMFSAENFCRQVETDISGLDEEYDLLFKYAINGFPQGDIKVTQIITGLWAKLMEELKIGGLTINEREN